MRPGLIAAAIACQVAWVPRASAEPTTVWLSDGPPEERFMVRADRQTGGTLHLWTLDVRYPPMPETSEDGAAVQAILQSMAEGKEVWEEFEIEPQIAASIREAVGELSLLTNPRDRTDVIRALLFEGAAVARGFDPEVLASQEEYAPFRFELEEEILPQAWIDAYALAGKAADRSSHVDGTAWYHYQDAIKKIERLPKASLEIPDGIGEVYVDGETVAPGILEIPPGRHYIHVVRDGVVHGRSVLTLEPGVASSFPSAVSADVLAEARDRVRAGKKVGIPKAIDEAVRRISSYYDGQVFLAATDGNKMEVVGYGAGAALRDNQLITFVMSAEVGAGTLVALGGDSGRPIFSELNDGSVVDSPGETGVVPAASAAVGFELGISHFLVAGGLDVFATPGRTITWSNGEDNRHASVQFSPWGGLGAYVVRPTKRTPTLAILGTAGWMSPSHPLYGGRLVVGVPVDDKGNDFRIAMGGSYGPDTLWKEPLVSEAQPVVSAWVRIGFGARL